MGDIFFYALTVIKIKDSRKLQVELGMKLLKIKAF